MKIDINKFCGVTCDSRNVQPGYIFVAIEGMYKDGHQYIHDAIQNGARLIVTQKTAIPFNIPFIQVPNARESLAYLSAKFYNHPSTKLHVTGITGTNGKTTTTHMLWNIFRKAGIHTGLIGTTGIHIDENYESTSLTTPDTEQLQKILNQMHKNDINHVFMEVSSHGIAQQRIDCIDFDAAIYTNISKDHLDMHHSFQEYLDIKSSFLTSLPPNRPLIVNADDLFADYIIDHSNSSQLLSYGIKNHSQSVATQVHLTDGISFIYDLRFPLITQTGKTLNPFSILIELPIYGVHNIYNALAAITTALYYEIPAKIIKNALKNFTGVKRRFQWVSYEPYRIIDDFCHNPAGYEAVFNAIQQISYRNLYIVNAIRGNRGIQVNRDNALVMNKWANQLPISKIFLTSSEDVVKEKDWVSKQEKDVFIEYLKTCPHQHIPTLYKALESVLSIATPKDLILLAGAQGMDAGQTLLHSLKQPILL